MKKILSLMLALWLALVLVACAGGESGAQPAASASGAGQPSSSAPPAPQQAWQDALAEAMQGGAHSAAPDDGYRTWYEVFVYSFYDSDGDGVGDLNGVTQMLDYIQYMGFNGIWLMPIHPSPTYHKYDVTDYYAIDPQYGTMEDFENLLAACEQRGIRVIMDLVLNHTSNEHPWFQAALAAVRSGEMDSPYIDYYHIEERAAGGAWHRIAGDWSYEGQFWSGMPDLNLASETLRAELADIAAFWLGKGVAGFRLDAVKEFVTGDVNENIEILRWFNDTVKAQHPGAYIVGENWTMNAGLYQYYDSGVDSFFDFPFATQDGLIAKTLLLTNQTAQKYGAAMQDAQQQISARNPAASDAPFFINHDNARASGFLRRAPALIKTAWGMSLMQSGNAFVYYGEEIGMSGSGKDENKRAPMLWTAESRAEGMTFGPPGMDTVEHYFAPVAEQIAQEDSILAYVRKAVLLRGSYPEIARGEIALLETGAGDDVLATARTWEGGTVYLVYNLSAEPAAVPLTGQLAGAALQDELSATGEASSAEGETLNLPPYTIAILR